MLIFPAFSPIIICVEKYWPLIQLYDMADLSNDYIWGSKARGVQNGKENFQDDKNDLF